MLLESGFRSIIAHYKWKNVDVKKPDVDNGALTNSSH